MTVTLRGIVLLVVLLTGCTREQMEVSWFWILIAAFVVSGAVDLATNDWRRRR